jgi:carbonic anhydrase
MEKARSHAAVVQCIDPRFRTPVEHLLAEDLKIPINEMTVTSVAGGAHDLARRMPGKGLIRFGCEVATNHHGAGMIVLINHHDCGAYGGSEQFASLEAEMRFHEEQLTQARDYILKKVPVREVRGYFAWMNGHLRLDRKC